MLAFPYRSKIRSWDSWNIAEKLPLRCRIQKQRWKIVGVMVVRNPFDMIATRTAKENAVLKVPHPLTHSPTWLTFQNCSNVQPKIRYCNELMRGSLSNGTMKVVYSSDVDDTIKTISHHAKARYPNIRINTNKKLLMQ